MSDNTIIDQNGDYGMVFDLPDPTITIEFADKTKVVLDCRNVMALSDRHFRALSFVVITGRTNVEPASSILKELA